jgi:hypothetical protein
MAISNIVNVSLILGFTDPASFAECDSCKSLLESNSIPFNSYVYANAGTDISMMLDPLNSWVWGRDYASHEFTNYPVIIWTEIDDDGSSYIMFADSLVSLQDSSLIANKNLIGAG